MEAKDVQSLQEAYASMYTTSEEATDLQESVEKEDVDVFDVVKGYLMTEHDVTEEEALKVMLELTDDERTAIVEMAPMKHVRTTASGQKRYSTKDDGRHQRGVSPDGKPGGVNAPRTVGPTGAAIYNTVRGLKKRIGL